MPTQLVPLIAGHEAALLALTYGLRLNGLQSPLGPSEASGRETGSGREADKPAMFRVVGETNGIRITRAGTASVHGTPGPLGPQWVMSLPLPTGP
ncbi:hypothetical protein [Deinococcus sp. LM3]|uniref:hypothetical protein n=1 Tax=Deinococcus sp. LM3 TaxID=1938608 RepID=UPI001180D46D|nr:hypothetical protein [Deinococcus sp. LM3]